MYILLSSESSIRGHICKHRIYKVQDHLKMDTSVNLLSTKFRIIWKWTHLQLHVPTKFRFIWKWKHKFIIYKVQYHLKMDISANLFFTTFKIIWKWTHLQIYYLQNSDSSENGKTCEFIIYKVQYPLKMNTFSEIYNP